MHSTILSILPLFIASSYVSAHGIVHDMTIGGKQFPGPEPNQGFRTPGDSIIRQVLDTSPVKGASNPALSCGTKAVPASLVADANPGDAVTFDWGAWPHRIGPIMTYLASCGSTSCDKFDSANARWFKIDQQAKSSSGTWVQADVADGQPARVTIPSNLAPGNYLMRHEILSLHAAVSMGGAEFYPSCSQLRVGGSGTGAPSESELVSFPGAYKDDDPGVFTPNIFSDSGNYVFPGPAVAKLVGGSSGGNGGGGSPANPDTSSTKAAPSASPSQVNNGGSSQSATVSGAASSTASPTSPPADDPSYDPPAASSLPSSAAAPTGVPTSSPFPPNTPQNTPAPQVPAPSASHAPGKSCNLRRRRSRSLRQFHSTPAASASPASEPITSDAPVAKRNVHSRVMRRLLASHSH